MSENKPRAWLTENEGGDMVWLDKAEADKYADEDTPAIPLFTAASVDAALTQEPVGYVPVMLSSRDEEVIWWGKATDSKHVANRDFHGLPRLVRVMNLYATPQPAASVASGGNAVPDREQLLGDAIRALVGGRIKCSEDLSEGARPVHVSARQAFGAVHSLLAATAPLQPRTPAEPTFVAPDAVWLVYFDDRDRAPEVLTSEAAARARFARISVSWNAHLFVKVESNSRDDQFAHRNIRLAAQPRTLDAPSELPRPGSPAASAMIDSLLAEYQWPSNSKNAARAGWAAARRFLSAGRAATPPQQAIPEGDA